MNLFDENFPFFISLGSIYLPKVAWFTDYYCLFHST